jgi:hypothetical protein
VLGTPFYMPPEQAMGKPVDHRADIYSLGITAFHMLTGTRPFEAKNRVDVMVMQVKTPLPDIRKLAPDAPEGLVKLIEKMCAKNPSERFQTMTEVLTALEAAAQEVPAAISVETPPARAHTPAKAPAHATPAKKSAAAPAPAPAAATPSRRTPVPAATGILPGPPPGLAPPAAGPSRAPLVLLVVGMLAAVGVGAGAYVMAAGEAGGWQVPDKGWSVDRENALRKVHRNGFGSCAFAPAPIRPDGTFEGLPALAFTPESPIHGRCFLAGPLGAGEMWHELWSDGKLLARVVYEPPPPPEARDFPLDVGGLHAGALAGLASGEHEVAVWLLRPRGEGRAQRLAGGSFTYRKP